MLLLLLFSGSALCTLCAALLLLLQQRANAKERTPHTLKWSWGYEVAWAHWKWNFVLNNASGSSSKSEIQNLRKVSWSSVRWFNACSNGELLWAHQSIQNPKDLRNIKKQSSSSLMGKDKQSHKPFDYLHFGKSENKNCWNCHWNGSFSLIAISSC